MVPEPFKTRIHDLKLEIKEKFESSHSLNSPPHLTLVSPFRATENDLNTLDEIVIDCVKNINSIQVELNNISHFDSHAIFIDVKLNEKLSELQSQLENNFRNHSEQFGYRYRNRSFRPHITLAFKDLTEETFQKAYHNLKNLTFDESFKVKKLSLLRHDGKKWEVFKEYPIK